MMTPVFWRVFWKEYRQVCAFWWAIVAIVILLEAIMVVAALFPTNGVQVEVFYGLALCVPVFYGLGCGAIMFAGEHEAETYDFQRALPVSAGQLLGGKLSFALLSALLLPCLLWVIAWLCAGRTLPDKGLEHFGLWAFGLGGSIELFAWAMLFSLLVGRVLWATVLSMGFVCLVGIVAVPSLDFFVARAFDAHHVGNPVALALHVIVTLAVLVIDAWLGRRWLREYPLPWSRPSASTRVARRRSADRRHGERMAVWGRLIWQAWIQARWTLAVILAVAGLTVALPLMTMFFTVSRGTQVGEIPLMLSPLVAAAIGATVYWSDQRAGQFRFFTDRGVSPRRIWASRQVVAMAGVLAWCVFAVLCLAGEFALYIPQNELTDTRAHFLVYSESAQSLLGVLGLNIVCYGIGQICSLSARSGVIGLFLGLLLSWVAGMWAMLMWEAHVPLWFSVAPIPLVLLWASWLRAPDWIAERAGWRSRAKLGAAISVPLMLIAVAVICYRIYEIPARQFKVTAEQRQPELSPEGIQTALIYYDAFTDFLKSDELESSAVQTSGKVAEGDAAEDAETLDRSELVARGVTKFMEASRRGACQFPSRRRWPQATANVSEIDWQSAATVDEFAPQLARSVSATCDALELDGQLETALDRYIAVLAFARHLYEGAGWDRQRRADAVEALVLQHLSRWAARPEQTAETIRAALDRLDREHFSFTPTRREGIVQDYLAYRRLLELDEPGAARATAHEVFVVWFTSHFAPWEHARAERLLVYDASGEILRLRFIEELERSGQCVHKVEDHFWDADVVGWVKTTPGFVRREWTESEAAMVDLVAMWATRRRIARLQLALAAWRAEHGELPRSLEELQGVELDSLPTDPFTARAFRYQPDGFGMPIVCRDTSDVAIARPPRPNASERTIDPGTPFLWGAGPDITYSPYTNSRTPTPAHPNEYTHVTYIFHPRGSSTPIPIVTEHELWNWGLCFPVP